MAYAQKEIEAVVELKKSGMKHRDIAEKVFGKRSMASSVWYILNEHFYKKPVKKSPRVLIFDLETSPELGYVWGRFKQFLAPVQVKQRSFLLTWAAKWLDEEGVMYDAIPNYRKAPERGFSEQDDFEIVSSLWRLLDECDVAIAHNGLRFDFPYINSRFAYHGLGMPSPYKTVDTCKIAKKYFRFPANSLKELGIYFGIETPKLDTDFQLWIDCMEGVPQAWEYMAKYNTYDVKLLEEVYKRVRPYDKSHPNMGLYYEGDAVRDPVTGSDNVVELDALTYTSQSAFKTYRSAEGHVFRDTRKVKGVSVVNAQ